MGRTALETFIADVRSVWGPLTTDVAEACQHHLRTLLAASPEEPWLADLLTAAPDKRELYRDPEHGFVLQAHTEPVGLYRPPHDHGRNWVIYGTQSGVVEMETYGRVLDQDGGARLVRRDQRPMPGGEARLYLPGDIHATRCVEGPALLFRFTERDLREDDRDDHRITRYVNTNGVWTAPGE